jgi:transposase
MPRIKYQEAAGLEVKRGRPLTGQAPSKDTLAKLYVQEGRSIREVAAALGCSKDTVQRAIKRYGIDARTNASRSKLRRFSLRDIELKIKTLGIRGLARDLGVDEGTIRHYLKVQRGY